jgi:hypothetical protein
MKTQSTQTHAVTNKGFELAPMRSYLWAPTQEVSCGENRIAEVAASISTGMADSFINFNAHPTTILRNPLKTPETPGAPGRGASQSPVADLFTAFRRCLSCCARYLRTLKGVSPEPQVLVACLKIAPSL